MASPKTLEIQKIRVIPTVTFIRFGEPVVINPGFVFQKDKDRKRKKTKGAF